MPKLQALISGKIPQNMAVYGTVPLFWDPEIAIDMFITTIVLGFMNFMVDIYIYIYISLSLVNIDGAYKLITGGVPPFVKIQDQLQGSWMLILGIMKIYNSFWWVEQTISCTLSNFHVTFIHQWRIHGKLTGF